MSIKSEQRSPAYLLQFISLVGALLLPITSLFMAWAIQRGLDITDESMYLVSSKFPADVTFGLTSFHLYVSVLFHSVGQNIIALRFVRLVMDILAGTVLYVGLSRCVSRYLIMNWQTMLGKAEKISLLALGSMFAYFWFLPSPSYNSLNSFALTVSTGLLLLLPLESETMSDRINFKTGVILFAIGLCLGLSFFSKFTTSVSLLLLYAIFISVSSNQSIRNKVYYILITLFGIFVWILLHFIFLQSPVLWWRSFSNGLQFATTMSAGYDGSSLPRYLYECFSLGKSALFDFWPLHIMILLGLKVIHHFKKPLNNSVVLISALFGAVFAAAVVLSILRHLYAGGQSQCFNLSRFYLSWLLLLMTAVFASLAYNHLPDQRACRRNLSGLLPVAILLFCLPFAGAIGTGNPLYINMLLSMAPWFGLLLLLAALLSWLHRIRWVTPVICVLFSAFASAQIVTGSLSDPYRVLTGLLGQTQATEIGYPPTTLKLDPMTSEYFAQIKALAHNNGFRPGEDVIGLYDLPGVVFALGGRSPALPWFIGNPRKAPAAAAVKALSFADQDRLKRAFILQTSKSDKIMPDLGKVGLNFPSGYMLCGEVSNPYDPPRGTVRLWKPL